MSIRLSTGNGIPCDQTDANDYPEIFPVFEPIAYVDTQHFAAALDTADIPHTDEPPNIGAAGQPCGTHSFRYFQRYLHDFWPQMIATFGATPPASFDYRRADPTFSVWGWTFDADPARAGEFLDIRDASCNGLTVQGSGVEMITTAPCFNPGEPVRFNGGPRVRVLRADRSGRLTFGVELGPAHTLQQYTLAEVATEAAGGTDYWTTRRVALVRSER
jgi:hypothetical protein